MTNHELDRIYYALSDSTRRAVLSTLSLNPAPVSKLAEPFEMALPTFLQHLKVLEECGLVKSNKEGRVRTVQLTPDPLVEAETWLKKRRDLWEARLNVFDKLMLTLMEEKNE